MTLKNAINFFESLEAETSSKPEIKVYQEFIKIITSLEKKSLSENEIQTIETELDRLNLKSNSLNRKKYFKKAINDFKKYLKDTFSLTTKGYYTTFYGGLGLVFGLLFGVAILSNLERSLGISLGLIGGMIVGSIMGRSKDSQAKTSGKML
jgi:F0F1-type ATP synthase assembly protein I